MTEPAEHEPIKHGHHLSDLPEPAQRVIRGGLSLLVAAVVAGVTLVGALFTVTAFGFVPLSGFEGYVIRSVEERLGPGWTVTMEQAELGRVEGRSAVRLGEVRVIHTGGMNIRAPEAVVSYDPLALLVGQVRVTNIDFRRVNTRLGVDEEGAIVLDAGASPVKIGQGLAKGNSSATDSSLLINMLAAFEIMARQGGELGALETASLSNSRLSLVDSAGHERIAFDQVNARMRIVDAGHRKLDISARGPKGLKDFTIDIASGENGARKASLELRRFEASDILGLALGERWGGIEGLALSGQASVESREAGAAPALKLSLTVAPGQARILSISPLPLTIDGGELELMLDTATGVGTVERLHLVSGGTDLALSGSLKGADGANWTAFLSGQGVVEGLAGDPPVRLDQMMVELGSGREGELALKSAQVVGPLANVGGSATLTNTSDGPALDLSLNANQTDVRAALALWPPHLSPQIRALLARHLRSGMMDRLSVNLSFSPEAMKASQAALPVPDEAVKVSAQGRGLSVFIADGLPLLTDAAATAEATGLTVNVQSPSARFDVGHNRVLALSEGRLSIADTGKPRPLGMIAFRAMGGADALAELLSNPLVRDTAPGQVNPDGLKGTVDLKATIDVPLAEDVKPKEIEIVASGQINQVSSDTLIGKLKLEGANLKTSYDRGVLAVKGEGRVAGFASTIEMKQDARGAGEAAVSFTLDGAARQKLGLSLASQVGGVVGVKIAKALGPGARPDPRVELDLTRASIDGLIPGWSKAAGKAARASFNFLEDDDGPDLDDFLLDSAPLMLKGKVSFDKQLALSEASFTSARLSTGDDVKLDIASVQGVTKLTIRGKVFDARPFLKLDGKEGEAKTDFDLDLAVPIVTGFNSEALGNAVIKASRRQGDYRQLSLQARIGRAPVTGQIVKDQGVSTLVIDTDDGGGLMRFYDFYRRAYGGKLLLQLPQGDARRPALLQYDDFTVRDEPALRRVLAEAPSGVGGDRASGGRNANSASGVGFTKLRATFIRTPSRIELKDAVLWGPAVGFKAAGTVDYGRDRIDIAGTLVPSYAFNNAFSQVPIFGQILTGGQNEGLFAVNFRLGGSPAAPTMSVNPLSAIAPGILRRFVDPAGGMPMGGFSVTPER